MDILLGILAGIIIIILGFFIFLGLIIIVKSILEMLNDMFRDT